MMVVLTAAQLGAQPVRRRSAAPARPERAAAVQRQSPVFDATGLGAPLQLDKGWRVGISADPAAASPAFDDSAWAVRNAQSFIDEVNDNQNSADSANRDASAAAALAQHNQRFAWFRLHIRLAPGHGPVGLLIELPISQGTAVDLNSLGPAVAVYANGKLIVPGGVHGDAPEHYREISRIYNLNVPADQTSLTLAVRTLDIPFGYASYTSFFASHTLLLGAPDDLARELNLEANRNLFERLPRLVYSILLLVLSGFLLALYFAQKGHVEYLWLALHELAQAPLGFIELAGSTARIESLLYAALLVQLVLASAYLFYEFLVSFLALKRRWYIRWMRYTAPILLAVGPLLMLVGRGSLVGILLAIAVIGSFLWLVVWTIFIFLTLISAAVRRNFEAALLLVPLVLSIVGIIEPLVTDGMSDLSGHPFHSPLTLQVGQIPIHFASIADYTGILVIVLIIFVRFLRIQREQEHASSELAAARSVQDLILPQQKLATPGFEVDSVYNPASEVGGDFFHVQSAGDEGMLVVIGDVAGKGLKAAMNVSMLMGALRRTQERSPAQVLASLNRVLVGSESFTTCMAAWFGANGELVLANAGHLPPYLNSQEVHVPGGLPLGVLADIQYEEVKLYLHAGDRILLVSDGVVEARQSSGEMFGFDRVHNLSNQSAFYIAEAAQAFGQEDDITVLTVRRLATGRAA